MNAFPALWNGFWPARFPLVSANVDLDVSNWGWQFWFLCNFWDQRRRGRVHNGAEVSEPFLLRGFLKSPILGFDHLTHCFATTRRGFHDLSSRIMKDEKLGNGAHRKQIPHHGRHYWFTNAHKFSRRLSAWASSTLKIPSLQCFILHNKGQNLVWVTSKTPGAENTVKGSET